MDWTQNVEIKQLRKNDFCMELRVGSEGDGANFWIIFVYPNTNARVKK